MKRTLLVDTNRAAYPIYQSLCEMGHEVWVVGNRPAETLAKLAQNYKQLDYANVEELAAFVEKKGFDYLVPGCTDISYEVCAQINNGRFPGIESPANTSTINQKGEFRSLAEKIELPVPRVLAFEDAGDGRPVIVIPVDSFSGRGITVLKNPKLETLERAHERACSVSSSGSAIIRSLSTASFIVIQHLFAKVWWSRISSYRRTAPPAHSQ